MKNLSRFILYLVCFILINTQTKCQTSLNLDFEYSIPGTDKPFCWGTAGWGYKLSIDTIEHFSGQQSLRSEHIEIGNFGVFSQSIPLQQARGKEIILTGYIKTLNVDTGYAGLWYRVDGHGKKCLAIDNMQQNGVKGTNDWKEFELKFFCDTSAENAIIGGIHPGNGIAWFDNFSIELNGEKYIDHPPFSSKPTQIELNWIKENAIKLKTVDAGNGFEDLEPLRNLIGDAKIVGLGESTHGTSEIFRLKHRIIEFLANEMGFNVFAIEASMPEAYKINDYIIHGKGDPAELLKGLYYFTCDTKEVLDMIEWMRVFNQSGKGKILFTGVDMNSIDTAAAIVKKYFLEIDSGYIREYNKNMHLLKLMNAYGKKWNRTDDENTECVNIVNEIITEAKKYKNRYLSQNHSPHDYEWVIQNINIILQATDNYKFRDRSMADNFDWILNNSGNDSKIVIWAHNYHISRDSGSMGYYLNQKYGNDYIPVGFALDTGTYVAVGKDENSWIHNLVKPYPGCLEYYLMLAQLPLFALDLRNLGSDSPESGFLSQNLFFRGLGAMVSENQFEQKNVRNLFDILIYITNSHHSQTFISNH